MSKKLQQKLARTGGNEICHNLADGRATFFERALISMRAQISVFGSTRREAREGITRSGLFVYGFSGLGPPRVELILGTRRPTNDATTDVDDWLPIC